MQRTSIRIRPLFRRNTMILPLFENDVEEQRQQRNQQKQIKSFIARIITAALLITMTVTIYSRIYPSTLPSPSIDRHTSGWFGETEDKKQIKSLKQEINHLKRKLDQQHVHHLRQIADSQHLVRNAEAQMHVSTGRRIEVTQQNEKIRNANIEELRNTILSQKNEIKSLLEKNKKFYQQNEEYYAANKELHEKNKELHEKREEYLATNETSATNNDEQEETIRQLRKIIDATNPEFMLLIDANQFEQIMEQIDSQKSAARHYGVASSPSPPSPSPSSLSFSADSGDGPYHTAPQSVEE